MSSDEKSPLASKDKLKAPTRAALDAKSSKNRPARCETVLGGFVAVVTGLRWH